MCRPYPHAWRLLAGITLWASPRLTPPELDACRADMPAPVPACSAVEAAPAWLREPPPLGPAPPTLADVVAALGQPQLALVHERQGEIGLVRPGQVLDGQLLVAGLNLPASCVPQPIGWQGQTYRAFAVRPKLWHVLLPVHLGLRPGPRPLHVACGGEATPVPGAGVAGAEARGPAEDLALSPPAPPAPTPPVPPAAVFQIPIHAGTFPESRLSVDPKFTSVPPPRVAQERAAIEAAFRRSGDQRLWSRGFARPSPGVLTSPFGVRRTFNQETKSRHLGLDFAGAVGDDLSAANDGVVALAAADFFYVGNAVLLDHGQNLFTLYFHMTELKVKTGDRVGRGQVLGTIGATGRVTGPHLHFAVKYAGIYINPGDLLAYDPATALAEADLTSRR